jgi:hypothetical protein
MKSIRSALPISPSVLRMALVLFATLAGPAHEMFGEERSLRYLAGAPFGWTDGVGGDATFRALVAWWSTADTSTSRIVPISLFEESISRLAR